MPFYAKRLRGKLVLQVATNAVHPLVQLRTQLVVWTFNDLLPFDLFQTGSHCVCANGVQSAANLYGTHIPPIVRVKLAGVCARDVHRVAVETEGPLVVWRRGFTVAL